MIMLRSPRRVLLSIILFLVLCAGAFIFLNNYIYEEKQSVSVPTAEEIGTVVLQGVVTDVDVSQVLFDGPGLVTFETVVGELHTIAVPSAGRSLCEASSAITDTYDVAVGDSVHVAGYRENTGWIVPCSHSGHYLRVESTYRNDTYGFSFDFKKGPEGYVLEDGVDVGSTHPYIVYAVRLIETPSYAELQKEEVPSEYPPALTIRVYKNTERDWATSWMDTYETESGIGRALGEPETVMVGGTTAQRYSVDGLYATRTYVIAHGGYVFVVDGMYIDADSDIYRDFDNLIDSFTFIPTDIETRVTFVCEPKNTFDVVYGNADVQAVSVIISNITYNLLQTESASGVRYANEDESVVFWEKGEESLIEMNGDVVMRQCSVQ